VVAVDGREPTLELPLPESKALLFRVLENDQHEVLEWTRRRRATAAPTNGRREMVGGGLSHAEVRRLVSGISVPKKNEQQHQQTCLFTHVGVG
jgi:hypothetical protein